MTINKNLLLTLVFALLSVPGSARAGFEAEFRAAAAAIPARLEKKGVRKVGALDLGWLRNSISGVQIIPVDKLKVELGEGNDLARYSGAWQRKGGRLVIYISRKGWRQFPGYKIREVLALHELLCVQGYEDTNYDISLLLYFFSRYGQYIRYDLRAFPSQLTPIVRKLDPHAPQRMASNGGGTTLVGGGGESFAISVKLGGLDDAGQLLARARTRAERSAAMDKAAWALYYAMEVSY